MVYDETPPTIPVPAITTAFSTAIVAAIITLTVADSTTHRSISKERAQLTR